MWKRFSSWLWTEQTKPSDWPDSVEWPLPKNVRIKEIIPPRYVIRDKTRKIQKILAQHQYQKQSIKKTHIIERLPTTYLLSDGLKVQGTLPVQYIQDQGQLDVFLENWNLKKPALFSTKAYQSAFLAFTETPLQQNHLYPIPKGTDKPTSSCLWFGIGFQWYFSHIMTGVVYHYLYQIRIKDSVERVTGKQLIHHQTSPTTKQLKILIVRDKKDADVFKQMYLDPRWFFLATQGVYRLKWREIGQQFCGIINYIPEEFSSWDVPSGCIWDMRCVHLDLVAEKKPTTTKRKQQQSSSEETFPKKRKSGG